MIASLVVTQITNEDNLFGTYSYLDDATVVGNNNEELKNHSMKFENALKTKIDPKRR